MTLHLGLLIIALNEESGRGTDVQAPLAPSAYGIHDARHSTKKTRRSAWLSLFKTRRQQVAASQTGAGGSDAVAGGAAVALCSWAMEGEGALLNCPATTANASAPKP